MRADGRRREVHREVRRAALIAAAEARRGEMADRRGDVAPVAPVAEPSGFAKVVTVSDTAVRVVQVGLFAAGLIYFIHTFLAGTPFTSLSDPVVGM
ncbi:hypothetical protein [Celeribacter arenosi]|uniref:Antenna pigment protein beta chain n=1 Tax=Celeribacter arenosi TaxID=792649 RepID=A0ABP7KCJ5_9RHOB